MTHVHVQTLISRDNHRAVTVEALDRGISLQKLMKEIIENHLNNKEGGKNEQN